MAVACADHEIKKSDVYGDFNATSDSSYLRKFEAEVAKYLGKEDAIFVVSGGMAQGIAAKIHSSASASASNAFVCHFSSHLVIHEQDAYPNLLNMMPVIVPPRITEKIQLPLLYRRAV